MKTLNFLTGDNATFTTGTGSWSVAGASAVNDTSVVVLNERHSLVLTPNTSSSVVTVTLSSVPILVNYGGSSVQFHSRVKCTPSVNVDVSLIHNQSLPATYEPVRSTNTSSNSWSVCRSNALPIPDIGTAVLATVELEITGHGGYEIYVTTPFMYGTFDADRAYFTVSTYAALPEFYREVERQNFNDGVMPELPIVRILESGLSVADEVFDSYYDIEYLDEDLAGRVPYTSTPSSLVSPSAVTDQTGEWLAQFLGFGLDNPQQTTTPWGGLPSTWHGMLTQIDTTTYGASINASSLSRSSNLVTATFAANHNLNTNDIVSVVAVDGTSTSFSGTFTVTKLSNTSLTWPQTGSDGSASETHAVGLVDSEWSEIEDSNPDFFDRAGYTAWQLTNAYSGLRAGTYEALVNAAKFNLSGNKVVTVLKHTTGAGSSNPWSILVRTKTSETPGGADNTSSEIVLTAITAVKPIGFKVEHRCTSTGL